MKTNDVTKERRQIAALCRWTARIVGTLLIILILPFAIEYKSDLLTETGESGSFLLERALS